MATADHITNRPHGRIPASAVATTNVYPEDHVARRGFLCQIVALPLIGACTSSVDAAPVFSGPDAHLLALGAEMDRLSAEKAKTEPEATHQALYDAQVEVMNQIARAPASTLDGFCVKARALHEIYAEDFCKEEMGFGGTTTDHVLIASIIFGLATRAVTRGRLAAS